MVKNLSANARDWGSIPGSGRSPGVGNGKLLQYSCLENSMDRGAWRAIFHGVAKSQKHQESPEGLSIHVLNKCKTHWRTICLESVLLSLDKENFNKANSILRFTD